MYVRHVGEDEDEEEEERDYKIENNIHTLKIVKEKKKMIVLIIG